LARFGLTWATYELLSGGSYYVVWGLAIYGLYAIGRAVHLWIVYRGKWTEFLASQTKVATQ